MILTWLMIAIRMASVFLLWQLGPVGWILSLPEIQATVCGIWNAINAPQVDKSWQGLITPLCYLSGSLFAPTFEPSETMVLLACFFALARLWVGIVLGASHSLGVPTFVRIVQAGPYAIVRHPLASLHLVSRFCLLCAWPSFSNLLCFFIGLGISIAAAMIEERYLLKVAPEYQTYSEIVKWRFIPGVI